MTNVPKRKLSSADLAADRKQVAILMASFNGARFIGEQLRSIADQTHGDWSLWVSDDGSSDATVELVAAFAADHRHRGISVRRGLGKGSTLNFLSLVCDREIVADYYALCDQDDVWLPEKLERAVSAIGGHGEVPALYGARTIIATADLNPTGLSPVFRKPPDFRNALVQSIAGGNTMVFNRAARDLLCAAGIEAEPVCHDWWLYQLISGAGGIVIYDPEPVLLYRQHSGNQIGANATLSARWQRLAALLRGRFREWNGRNIAAMTKASGLLLPGHRELLRQFAHLSTTRGVAAVRILRRAGIFRQTRSGEVSLRLAAFFGKL